MLRIKRLRTSRRPFVAMLLTGGVLLSAAVPALAARPRGGIGTTGAATATAPGPDGALGLTQLVGGLTEPLYVTNAGGDRLYVVEKPGRIRVVRKVDGDWRINGTFLDIRSIVGDSGSEQGLLGLAFHPDYDANGKFYVNYTNNNGNTVVAEFRRETTSQANRGSKRVLFTIEQPYTNHNGGWLGFKDRYLYIATGDGGSGGDPGNRAQDLQTRLGKILRIDPLDPDGSGPEKFSIPSSNPFVGQDGLDIIWSYGLRNPWRNSFDSLTGDFWLGDVGQELYEEVSRVASGSGTNFGWRLLEGRHRYPSGDLCASDCKTLPVIEYSSSSGSGNCSVTGGYVARRAGTDLYGRYIFGDFCSGWIWDVPTSQDTGDPLPTPFTSGRLISSFGEGFDGKIYLTDLNGTLWRVSGT